MADTAKSSQVAKWTYEIDRYDKRMEKWTRRCAKIIKRYADERGGVAEQKESRYNALWSNIQTLSPALYVKLPKPEIDRRYKDSDPVGRLASELLQRCASFSLTADSHAVFRQALADYLLTARGTCWVRYVPHFRDVSVLGPAEVRNDGDELTDDHEIEGDPKDAATLAESKTDETVQEVVNEEVIPDYVHWKDFGHTEGRTWEEVRAVWRIAYLGRDALKERFGDKVGEAIPLNWGAKDSDTEEDKQNRDKKAAIYEIWDKTNRKVLWICKDHPDVLDERDDPLGLTKFFPCPKPLYATLTNEKLEPIPDYAMYQDQAIQLDDLTARITSITKSLKVAGVFDASAQGIARLLNEGVENQLIPVESWAAFAEKGGLKGAVEFLPVADIAQTLLHLYECREKVKGDMYEITGLSDIVRGDTDAQETASAQRIKGQYAGVRMQDRRGEVQRFIRDTINLMVEVIAGHFSPDTLKKMSGLQMFDTVAEKQQALQALLVPGIAAGLPPAAMPGGPPQPGMALAMPVPGMLAHGLPPRGISPPGLSAQPSAAPGMLSPGMPQRGLPVQGTPAPGMPMPGAALPVMAGPAQPPLSMAPQTMPAPTIAPQGLPPPPPPAPPSEELQQKLDNPTWNKSSP